MTDKLLSSEDTQRILGSDPPIAVGKLPVDPLQQNAQLIAYAARYSYLRVNAYRLGIAIPVRNAEELDDAIDAELAKENRRSKAG